MKTKKSPTSIWMATHSSHTSLLRAIAVSLKTPLRLSHPATRRCLLFLSPCFWWYLFFRLHSTSRTLYLCLLESYRYSRYNSMSQVPNSQRIKIHTKFFNLKPNTYLISISIWKASVPMFHRRFTLTSIHNIAHKVFPEILETKSISVGRLF